MTVRHLLMAVALAGAAWLALWGDRSDSLETVEPTRPAASGPVEASVPQEQDRSRTTAADPVVVALRERPAYRSRRADSLGRSVLFGTQSWTPPPPKPVVLPPAPPQAPPLPYTYVGKKQDGERWEVYLSQGEDTRVARVNAVIDGVYRVESIRPPTLTLVYLPLHQAQQLNIGASD